MLRELLNSENGRCLTRLLALGTLWGGVLWGGVMVPAQDTKWLQANQHTNPRRVEGLLDQPNGRREYNVLSLLALPGHSSTKLFAQTPTDLSVHYCRDTGVGNARSEDPAYITVRQLSGHANYLMKATSESGAGKSHDWSVFSWPTGDVITGSGIDVNKLGVIVHLGENNDYAPDMAPVIFSGSEAAPSEPVTRYLMALRVQHAALSSLSYTITPEHGAALKPCFYQNELHACVHERPSSQAPIDDGSLVHLDLDLAGVAPGRVTLQLDGQYLNDARKLAATFHFVHEPTCR